MAKPLNKYFISGHNRPKFIVYGTVKLDALNGINRFTVPGILAGDLVFYNLDIDDTGKSVGTLTAKVTGANELIITRTGIGFNNDAYITFMIVRTSFTPATVSKK